MITVKDRKVSKTISTQDYVPIANGTLLYSKYSRQIVPSSIVNLLKTRWEVKQ